MIDDDVLPLTHPKVWAEVAASGSEWTPEPRPKGVRKRRDKGCFLNAALLATDRFEFTYCEGFALSPSGWWVHHAWCVTEDGKVVDNTWREIGTRYVGFTVPRQELFSLLADARWWGGVVDAR